MSSRDLYGLCGVIGISAGFAARGWWAPLLIYGFFSLGLAAFKKKL